MKKRKTTKSKYTGPEKRKRQLGTTAFSGRFGTNVIELKREEHMVMKNPKPKVLDYPKNPSKKVVLKDRRK